MEHGYCVMCGCSIIEKSFESKACEEGCYPELKSKENWEKFKKQKNITIC